MCQVEPFVLPCCSRVYVDVKRTPSCPAEWPDKKCPPDLCIQVRGFEPLYKPTGKCWRCKGRDEGLKKEESEDKYRPSVDRAEVVMGLEEVTPKERREHTEHWGNCWFCHSSGDCKHCGARKIRSYTPPSSPVPTMAVSSIKQEVTTPGTPRARVPKRERPESMYDVKKRCARKLKQENGGVTPTKKRPRKNASGATPAMQMAIANTRRRPMNGPKPANFVSSASTANTYGAPNVGTMTAPGNFYKPSLAGYPPSMGSIPERSMMHSQPSFTAPAKSSPSLSTYNNSPYGTRNTGTAPFNAFDRYGNTSFGNPPLTMGYPPLPSSIYSNAPTFKQLPSMNKPNLKSPLSKVATYPAIDLSLRLNSNLASTGSAAGMSMMPPATSRFGNTGGSTSVYAGHPVQQNIRHNSPPTPTYEYRAPTAVMQTLPPPQTQQAPTAVMQPPPNPQRKTNVATSSQQPPPNPQSNTNVAASSQRPAKSSTNLNDVTRFTPEFNIDDMDFNINDPDFDDFLANLYPPSNPSSDQSSNPAAPYTSTPHGNGG